MATKGWPAGSKTRWTYGAEFELSDFPQSRPHRWRTDLDWTMVNSNGIAVDPSGRVYKFGGEILTFPTTCASGVSDQLSEFIVKFPEASVNYRSNLHIHVRVPGLRGDLGKLKKLQMYNSRWLPILLPIIEPIPAPLRSEYLDSKEWLGARKRYARRKVSHQRIMPDEIVSRQLAASSCTQFFDAEAIYQPTGKLLWATKPRCAVNLRQLLVTDTIEFRHFPGTCDPLKVFTAVCWCRDYLKAAFDDANALELLQTVYSDKPWPKFHPYIHWMEERFLVTNPHYVGVGRARREIARLI